MTGAASGAETQALTAAGVTPRSGMRSIGSARLLGLPSVLDLGRKLQRAAMTLGFDRHAATEVAAVVSEAGRHLVGSDEVVTVLLRHGRASGNLQVEFVASHPSHDFEVIAPLLRRAFDSVRLAQVRQAPRGELSPETARPAVVASRASRPGQPFPSDLRVSNARDQFAERSRDALLLEVKQQNDDLEERVATRTAEVEAALRAAEAANESKSTFLSSMSHELRTPLNGVLGYAQLLQHDPLMSAGHRDKLSGIESCAKHLLGLIGELLDFSKIEAGKLELLVEGCDVGELLESATDIVRSRVNTETVTLRLDNRIGPRVCFRTDEAKLRQVFVNLLGNSAKFTERGEIVLRAEEVNDDWLRFSVVDTGPGMTAEELERLFQPFNQGKAGHVFGGTGLGLTISKSIVEGLEGSISATSTPGEGASFVVDLPRIAAVADRREDPQAPVDPTRLEIDSLHELVLRLAAGTALEALDEGSVQHLPAAASDSLEVLAARGDMASLENFARVINAIDARVLTA